MSGPHCSDCCCFVANFGIRKCESSSFAVFQNCVAVQCPLKFYVGFRIFLIFLKTTIRSFTGTERVDCLGECCHLNNSKPSVNMGCLLLKSFFRECFVVSSAQAFTFLG